MNVDPCRAHLLRYMSLARISSRFRVGCAHQQPVEAPPMLTILGKPYRFCDGISRRSFLRIGGLALGGLSLPRLLCAAAQNENASPRHKGIIMIFLPGGPPHLDMYDLKPEAPAEIRGEFKPIKTAVPGIEICELMPRLASMMDKLTVIRSRVGAAGPHYAFQCLTGNHHRN